MAKHVVLSPIKHDGETHPPGAELDLSAKIAAPLVKVGAVKPLQEPKKAPEKTKEGET